MHKKALMKSENGKEKTSTTGPFWTAEGYRMVRHSCITINFPLKSMPSLSFWTEWEKEMNMIPKLLYHMLKSFGVFC